MQVGNSKVMLTANSELIPKRLLGKAAESGISRL